MKDIISGSGRSPSGHPQYLRPLGDRPPIPSCSVGATLRRDGDFELRRKAAPKIGYRSGPLTTISTKC